MNYMTEVAKMLGVELGEAFDVGQIGVTYVLRDNGLFYVAENKKCDHILINLLEGKTYIKHKPWKPKDEEMFFVVAYDGSIMTKYWDNENTLYRTYYKIGNCYRHFNEAKDYRDKWVAFYASDEVLEV